MNPHTLPAGTVLLVPIDGRPQRMEFLGLTVSLFFGGEMARFRSLETDGIVLLPASRVQREAKEAA